MTLRILILLVLFLGFTGNAFASSEAYVIKNIAVDMEGENAIKARESAMKKARRDAFNILSSRLLNADARQSLPQASDAAIAAMINDFEINREKYSKNRYLASINITFNDRAVQGYFGRYTNIALPDNTYSNATQPYDNSTAQPHTTASTGNTRLILPWYGEGSAVTLWREPNPWKEAWANWTRTPQGQASGFIVPIGDITDMQIFNPEKPLNYDQAALDRLLARYKASEAIIAMADPLPNGMIRANLYKSTTMLPRFIDRMVVASGTMSGANAFLPAVYQSAAHIQQAPSTEYSIANADQVVQDTPSFAVDNTVTSALEAEVRLAGIHQWIAIKRSLSSITAIDDLAVKSLSAGRAVITFRYAGDAESLRRDLEQRGLAIYANPVQISGNAPYIITSRNG